MKKNSLKVNVAAALALVTITFSCIGSAVASTVSFSVGPDFAGGSVNGFTFSGNWRNGGYHNVESTEPYMEWNDQRHSVSYDAGTFNFFGMSVSGRPWNFSAPPLDGGTLVFDFLDDLGNIITTSSITLPWSNSFTSFNQYVAGVHRINFHATGYLFPRLASMDIAPVPVPEPETYAMLLAGLSLLGFMARRRKVPAT